MGKAIACALGMDKNNQISIIKKDESLVGLRNADFIILAIKPKDVIEVAEKIKREISPKSIIISILAGTKLQTLSRLLNTKKIVRVMPNLGLSVGAGIAVWKMNNGFTAREQVSIRKLLNAICENMEVKDEKKIDAATAISGSGPAYFFALANGMMQGAQALGLDTKTSRLLVSKTLSAAGKLQGETPYETLILKIASKGGTTEAALKEFKKADFRKTVLKAVKAAHKRAEVLGK